MAEEREHIRGGLAPYMTPAGAWALSLGTAIGWGSLVVTSNSYLLQAGPIGSVAGLVLGALVMILIARNYHYMINCFPDAGGAYTYAKAVYGYDHGFMTAWFLGLTYIAILWANATSLPLFAKYFIGDVFQFGYLYTVFGYDVYLGEALLTIVAVVLTALFLARSRIGAMRTMVIAAVVLSVAIVVCFAFSTYGFATDASSPRTFDPLFLPDESAFSQILLIACISPWAFIGFVNISHSSEEFSFPRTRAFRIMVIAIVTATVLYLCVLLMSVMAYPDGFESWHDYIANRGDLSGIAALPPFYVAYHYMGDAGVVLLMVALLGLVLTSLIGNTLALSRLFLALAKDRILPQRFASVNERHIPGQAIVLIAVLSLIIPFLGRTAIGWIVDVTTLGATIIYGLVSAAALRVARARGDSAEKVTGLLGLALMIAFGAHIVLPSLVASSSLEPESFFLFAVWGIAGFIVFRILLSRDESHRFGRSAVVWIALLSLVMFVTFVWMGQTITQMESEVANGVAAYVQGGNLQSSEAIEEWTIVEEQLFGLQSSSTTTLLVAAALFAVAAAMLLMNFSYMSKWARESEEALDVTRNIIYNDPLTGLPSMTRFNDLAREGAADMLADGARPAAIALNFTGLSGYNVKYGRDGGDRLLKAFARALQDCFGEGMCARFAEDRFYAVVPVDEAQKKLDELLADFQGVEGEGTLPVRAGVYPLEEGDDIVSTGFERARSACDLNRKTWQSHISWFEEDMSDEARMRMHILDSVDRAIEEGWIRPYYQGIVDSRTGKLGDEEALARWIDPDFGFLSPGQFIPVLEETELLYKVDMYMVDCVLRDLRAKMDAGVRIVPISVNISLDDIEHHDAVNLIIQKTAAAGISPDLLRVEFTESVASEDPTQLESAIEQLHKAGFQVWMDDFGSGFSSLNSLKNFEFDLVKLDMDFLRDERGGRTWDVIEGIVQITRKLGMRTLTEGIETEVQAQRLTDLGCDLLQGYYYAKPVPLEEAMESPLR